MKIDDKKIEKITSEIKNSRYIETFKTWNKVAVLYAQKFMDLQLYDETYDVFCNLMKKKNAAVLEIGCGPGNISKYLLSKRPDFDILGIDIAPNMIKLAKKNNPSAQFKLMDSRDIDTLTTKFDAIICGFCLPYLSDIDRLKLISDCKKLLSKNGILYISFVEGKYKNSDYQVGSKGSDRVFFYYHELKFLEAELKKYDFELISIINIDYNLSVKTERHTVVIVQKKNNK
ncbi:MAG: methyltransferase domain-containing protein [Saprospiraceae bacterium]